MRPDDITRALSTEADLIAEGERMIREAEYAIATARKMIAMAEGRRVALLEMARVHGVQVPLHLDTKGAIDKHMSAVTTKEAEAKRMGPPVVYKHALALWIKNHGTADALAATLSKSKRQGGTGRDVSVSAVRSWYLDPPHGRPCPEDVQDILSAAPYFIPRSAWKTRPSR